MLFSVKDTFRAMVEYDSDGKNTVIYDDFGNPNVVVIISKYDMSLLGISELPSGTHPAFIINGEKEVDEIFVGKYDSVLGDGNVCTSMIGDPMELKGHLDTDKYVQQCIRRKGKGWHAMTSIEWGAVALISWKLGTIPHGNMNWGGSSVGAVIWTGDEDGNYINRPFLKNVNMLDKKFDDGARKRICEDGWVYTHTWLGIDKFAGNFSLNSSNNMSTITGQNSVYGTLDGISNRCSGDATHHLRTMKLIGVVPPDGAKTGVRGQVEHSVAGYRSLVRGFRNGDNADYYSNAFGWGAPLTPGVCYTSRLAWVSPDKI